jgi:hypothetical protein
MANIRQTIPNYIQGISQQPDELKVPGQVRDALNCIPDVTTGLSKRPGARLINPIGYTPMGETIKNFQPTQRDGHWFTFEGEDKKSFIGVIKRNGVVLIWDTYSGLPEIVKYQQVPKDFDPDGNTSVVAFPECNSGKFKRQRKKVETLQGSIDQLQEEVNDLQKKLDLDDKVEDSESYVQASIQKFSGNYSYDRPLYLVNSGYVELKQNYEGGKDIKTINPPDGNKSKGRVLINEKVYVFNEKGYEKFKQQEDVGRGPESLRNIALGIGKIYGWKVSENGNDGLDPDERERIERDLETAKEELLLEQAELREEFAKWSRTAAECGYSPSADQTAEMYNLTPKVDPDPNDDWLFNIQGDCTEVLYDAENGFGNISLVKVPVGYEPTDNSAEVLVTNIYKIDRDQREKISTPGPDQYSYGVRYIQRDSTVDVLRIAIDEAEHYLYYRLDYGTCGVNDFTTTSLPISRYLRHSIDEDLQTTTLNNKLIVTNRTVPVTMNNSDFNFRPYEAYIELELVKYNEDYRIEFVSPNNKLNFETSEDVTTATKLSIRKVEEVDNLWTSGEDGGACNRIGRKIFSNETQVVEDPKEDDGFRSCNGLSFEVNITGQSVQKNAERPQQGYVCEYRVDVKLLNGGNGWKKGDVITVEASEEKYEVTVDEISTRKVKNLLFAADHTTPADGSTVVKAIDILNALQQSIELDGAEWDMEAEIIGNGIYVTSSGPFQIDYHDTKLFKIVTDEASDVTQLPRQCKAGYIVKIANSAAEEDDYYLQFHGQTFSDFNVSTTDVGMDGAGVWKETFQPGIATNFNYLTMPHQITRITQRELDEIEGVETDAGEPVTQEVENYYFIVRPIAWGDREVGDDLTNPVPSFVSERRWKPRRKDSDYAYPEPDGFEERKFITATYYYRNRLIFLSGTNVVLSQPIDDTNAEQFNFWSKTALTVSDDDVIDVTVLNKEPATLYHGLPVNAGFVLFTPSSQHLLTTDNDVLSARTIKINKISSYSNKKGVAPFSMGATIGFVNESGVNSRMYEMTNIQRQGEVEVLEISKPISSKIPNGIDQLTESKESTLVIMGKRFTRELWVYRYFNNGEKRIQSAWVRWELTGDLIYHTIVDDVYYCVVRNWFENNPGEVGPQMFEVYTMQRIDLKRSIFSAIVSDFQNNEFSVHMDNFRVVYPTDMNYYPSQNVTYFRLPLGYFSDKKLAAYSIDFIGDQGRAMYPKVEIDAFGTWCILEGNWKGQRLMLGYEFTFGVEFPTIYMQKQEGTSWRSDINANLTLHRAEFSLGPSGVYDIGMIRLGHMPADEEGEERRDKWFYETRYETRPEDKYLANDVAFVPEVKTTYPIYDKNINLSPSPYGLYLMSDHPSPATLYSMSWEGNYSPMYYKRV